MKTSKLMIVAALVILLFDRSIPLAQSPIVIREQDGIRASLTILGRDAVTGYRILQQLTPELSGLSAYINGRPLRNPKFRLYTESGELSSVLLLLDVSNSRREVQIRQDKLTLIEMAKKAGPHDQIAVATYASGFQPLAPADRSPVTLANLIATAASQVEAAKLGYVLQQTMNVLSRIPAQRRGIFVLTDGHSDDNVNENVLILQAKASGISLYFVISPSERPADTRALKAIANATYGLVVGQGQLAAFLKAPFALLESGMTVRYPLDDARQYFWDLETNVQVVFDVGDRQVELSVPATVPKAGVAETASYLVSSHPIGIFGSAGAIVVLGGVAVVALRGRRRRSVAPAAPDPKPLPILAVLEDIGSGTVYPIQAPLVQVGRDKSNDIVLDDGTISRVHAVLQQRGFGEFSIENRSGPNGTMVNHQQVEKSPLSDGDLITMGGKTFRFGRVLRPGA